MRFSPIILSFVIINIPQSIQQECIPSIADCDPNFTTYVQKSRLKPITMLATYPSGCKYSNFKWSINDGNSIINENHENVNPFIIEPYTLRTGEYGINLEVTGKDGKIEYAMCMLEIKPEIPIPIILGGSERVIPSGQPFKVDGSKSINLDQQEKMEFNWKCSVLQGENKNFCDKLNPKSGESVDVPAEWAISGYKYSFNLGVSTFGVPERTTTQQISITENAVEIEIICEKNCPPTSPTTDATKITFLKAECVKNCGNFDYEWTVNLQDFSYEKDTQFGRNGEKFVINPGVFKEGAEIRVDLKLKGATGGSSKILKIDAPVKVESCVVTPSKGVALETIFKVDCKITGDVSRFEIFTSKNSRRVLVQGATIISSLNFRLPAGEDVSLKTISSSYVESELKLQVEVEKLAINEDTIKKFSNSLDDFIKNKNYDSAVQIMNGMIETLKDDNSTSSSARNKLKGDLLQKLSKLPMDNIQSAIRVASLVNKIVQQNENEPDPNFGHIATRTCKIAANKQLKLMKSERFPKSLSPMIAESTKLLVSCTEVNTVPNKKALTPPDDLMRLTTPFPPLDDPTVNVEDYPDYDDVSVESKRLNFEKSSIDMMDTCVSSTKALAFTMAEGEKTVESDTRFCTASATKLSGSELARTVIKIKNITIRPSEDFENPNQIIDVLVCSWTKDPFWWNLKDQKVSSNVFMVEFVDSSSDKVIDQFSKPTYLQLEMYKNNELEVREIPLKSKPDNPEVFASVRVDVPKNQPFFVEFLNFDGNDTTLDVILTDFRRPNSTSDFNKKIKISAENSIIYEPHDHDYDGFHYVTILRTNVEKVSISVYTLSCKTWNSTAKEWEFACKGTSTSNKSMIICECHHLSVLAGTMTFNNIVIENETLSSDFEMELIGSPTILIATAVIFGLYCILSLIVIRKVNAERKDCYFLGDCLCSARYCYLISVKTGKNKSAGTTSNVCIRLSGSNGKSKAHVLNYPDPALRFLQKSNEDWFTLAELGHLGNIEEIELWSDSTGRSPSWFCSNVTIYDLQTLEKWSFSVKKWLRLLPNGEIFTRIQSNDKKPPSKKMKRKILAVWKRVSTMRSESGPKFPYFRRLTILLSVILTTYLTNLVVFGLPKLEYSDGFFETQSDYTVLIFLGIACLANFVFHKILVCLFNFADKAAPRQLKYLICCWIVLTLNIVVAISILIVFGFWLPVMTSIFWIMSTLVSLVIYWIILEGTYTFFWNICARTGKKIGETKDVILKKLSEILKSVDVQRSLLCRQFGEATLRPYMKHLYHPLNDNEIKLKKYKLESKLRISELLEDTVMFILYITLLYLVILADRDDLTTNSHTEIVELVSGVHTRSFPLDEIQSLDDFYEYLNETLIVAMQSPNWYSRFVLKDAGLMADFQNKYIGVARLRQHRLSRTAPCEIPQNMRWLFNDSKCRPEFTEGSDSQPFGTGEGRMAKIWNYTKMGDAGTFVIVGKFGIYPGGGFIAPLGRTIYNSYVNLDYLKTKNWLDEETRAVFVEFLTYNANVNLFSSVRITVEKSATGYIRPRLYVETVKLLFKSDSSSRITLGIFAGFVLIVAVFTGKLLVRICKKRRLFFGDLWHLVDILIAFMCAACFGIYIQRMELVGEFLDRVEKAKRNDFVNYFTLLRANSTLTTLAAFLVCISTVRLWKLLRFGAIFRLLEKTLAFCAVPILGLFLYHVAIMVAFSLSGYAIFGAESPDFKDIPDTIVTLVILSLNLFENFDLGLITTKHSFLGYLFYSTFMVTTFLIYTMYITVILAYYCEAQIVHSSLGKTQDLKDYIVGEARYFRVWSKLRLKGAGDDVGRKVCPKADEHRYAGCMTNSKNRLELMRLLALRELKKDSNVDKEEMFDLARDIAKYALLDRNGVDGDDVEMFFKSGSGGRGVKLIPDARLLQMEKVVESLLTDDKNAKEREKRMKAKKEKYKRVLERQERKLKFIEESLQSMSNTIDKIEIIL